MFNKNSVYAINKKDPKAIVYPTATGETIRVTQADFATEEEFLYWKTWSNQDFKREDLDDIAEDKHTLSINNLSEVAVSVPAPDIIAEKRSNRAKECGEATETVMKIKGKLTEKQFRRLWMYRVWKMTEAEIAVFEGTAQQQISKSIKSAEKKIKKIFPTSEKQGVKTPQKS